MFLTYFVTIIVIVITIGVTMVFKLELERMFGAKQDEMPFHFANIAFTLMSATGIHAMMTIFVSKQTYHLFVSVLLIFICIIPLYYIAHRLAKKYKQAYKPYAETEDHRVVQLNEKYLKRKQLPRKLRVYNAGAKDEDTLRKYRGKRFFKDDSHK